MAGAVDPRVIDPGTAPTPFTAAEIREGCPPGRVVTVRVVVPFGPARLETTRWVSCDDDGAVMEKTVHDATGERVLEIASYRASWAELQAHASFPENQTEITRETVVTQAGVFDCLRYAVDEVGEFWFAVDLPGMPIKIRTPDREVELVENVG